LTRRDTDVTEWTRRIGSAYLETSFVMDLGCGVVPYDGCPLTFLFRANPFNPCPSVSKESP